LNSTRIDQTNEKVYAQNLDEALFDQKIQFATEGLEPWLRQKVREQVTAYEQIMRKI
jgi:hypothetical protein